jgi:hypothetical protein
LGHPVNRKNEVLHSTVEEIQGSSDPIDPFLEFEDFIIFENPKNRIE